MKIVLTGSLGHIGKPLAQDLVQKGHDVTVISSRAEKQKGIQETGAFPAIGHLEDADFLATVFTGADAVYCMTPTPGSFFHNIDLVAHYLKFGPNYLQAIHRSGVKRIVQLSSVGAHTDQGNGILRYAYETERILKQLAPEVSITFMRPVGFYYNLLAFIPEIKEKGVMVSNYGGEDKKPWVSPLDIAAACAEELTDLLPGKRKIRYVASDELSCNDIAGILGAAVGRPELKWQVISDGQMLGRLTEAGMYPDTARGFVEMNANMQSGKLYEDYYRHKPVLGTRKMTDFAGEFAKAYYQESFHNN
ncbi:MAG TPA: NAD(P)H-binding protein [Edaphocola sp.]|nr:NAD(P)H-binding protein [Edaphocola sp.]